MPCLSSCFGPVKTASLARINAANTKSWPVGGSYEPLYNFQWENASLLPLNHEQPTKHLIKLELFIQEWVIHIDERPRDQIKDASNFRK